MTLSEILRAKGSEVFSTVCGATLRSVTKILVEHNCGALIVVDKDDAVGRFILSGSQNFLLLKSVSQSLAGRCAILHLLPFSLSELNGRHPLKIPTIGRDLPRARRPVRLRIRR